MELYMMLKIALLDNEVYSYKCCLLDFKRPFRCLRPECGQPNCRNCQQPRHEGLSCAGNCHVLPTKKDLASKYLRKKVNWEDRLSFDEHDEKGTGDRKVFLSGGIALFANLDFLAGT
jgi:hypothetical protein